MALKSLASFDEVAPHFSTSPLMQFLQMHKTALLSTEGYIAGGAIRDLVVDRTPKDIDIFFASAAKANTFAQYLTQHAAAESLDAAECPEASTPHVLNYLAKVGDTEQKLQLCISRSVAAHTPENLLSWFDFTVSQICVTPNGWLCGPYTISDLKDRVLRYHNIDARTSARLFLERFSRYCTYGFRPSDHTLELVEQTIRNPRPKTDSHILKYNKEMLKQYYAFFNRVLLPTELVPSQVELVEF